MVVITDINDIDIALWDKFVYDHPNGSIFQSSDFYLSFLNNDVYIPILIIVVDNDNIVGVSISVIQKEFRGLLGYFTARCITWGGPLVIESSVDQVFPLILKKYDELLKTRAIYSQFRNFWNTESYKPIFKKHGILYEDHLNIINRLDEPIDIQWSKLSKSRKKGIKKAKLNNFEFSESNAASSLPVFYKLLCNLYGRIKLPIPSMSHFESLDNVMSKHNHLKVFNLTKNGDILISFMGFKYMDTLYGYYIGHLDDDYLKSSKAIDLFYWELICWGSSNGLKRFDWMGAGKPDEDYGVRDFKLQYGGDLVNFGRYTKIHNPLLMNMAKVSFKIWRLLKR